MNPFRPVGQFVSFDLARCDDFVSFTDAMSMERDDDAAYIHSNEYSINLLPNGLTIGSNFFGTWAGGSSVSHRKHTTRELTTCLLNDAIYYTNSLTIADKKNNLFIQGYQNMVSPDHLAKYDPWYSMQSLSAESDHKVLHTRVGNHEVLDQIVIPLCAAGNPNYGHYLFDGLGAAFCLSMMLPNQKITTIGQGLAPWKREILAALNLLDNYKALKAPVVCRKILASTTLSKHVSQPSFLIRPAFDMLRLRFGANARPTRKLLISRSDIPGRVAVNWNEIEQIAIKRGFEVIFPERMTVAEQVLTFASAAVVVGEHGAAMANIGFCLPGASVLEIQPANRNDSWIKSTAFFMGLRWHVFQCRTVPNTGPMTLGTKQFPPGTFLFEMDQAEFEFALDKVCAHAFS